MHAMCKMELDVLYRCMRVSGQQVIFDVLALETYQEVVRQVRWNRNQLAHQLAINEKSDAPLITIDTQCQHILRTQFRCVAVDRELRKVIRQIAAVICDGSGAFVVEHPAFSVATALQRRRNPDWIIDWINGCDTQNADLAHSLAKAQ